MTTLDWVLWQECLFGETTFSIPVLEHKEGLMEDLYPYQVEEKL